MRVISSFFIIIITLFLFGCASDDNDTVERNPNYGSSDVIPMRFTDLPVDTLIYEYNLRGGIVPEGRHLQGFITWDGLVCDVWIHQKTDFPGGMLNQYHTYLGHETDHCRGYTHDTAKIATVDNPILVGFFEGNISNEEALEE